MTHVLSDEPSWEGFKGRISLDIIKQCVRHPDVAHTSPQKKLPCVCEPANVELVDTFYFHEKPCTSSINDECLSVCEAVRGNNFNVGFDNEGDI